MNAILKLHEGPVIVSAIGATQLFTLFYVHLISVCFHCIFVSLSTARWIG